jgi:hypothetical protein
MVKMMKKLNLKKIDYICGSRQLFQGLNGKNHLHIVFMLNLKFQPDKCKNNEENAIIVFCSIGCSWPIFFKSHHIPYFHIAIFKCKENREITVFTNLVNTSIIPLFAVFWSIFSFWLSRLNAFGWNCQMHCCCFTCVRATLFRTKKSAVEWV